MSTVVDPDSPLAPAGAGILYLHGFTSGPQSYKARVLAEKMNQRGLAGHFVCPQLPPSPRAAIALAESLLGTQTTVVGSSLGGFYAAFLAERYHLRAVLVNPAVVAPMALEGYIGTHRHLYTGETFELTRDHMAEMQALDVPAPSRPERFWLLLETGDEVLDWQLAAERFRGARQTILEGGDHSFTRWPQYLDQIIDFAGL